MYFIVAKVQLIILYTHYTQMNDKNMYTIKKQKLNDLYKCYRVKKCIKRVKSWTGLITRLQSLWHKYGGAHTRDVYCRV